MQVSLPQKLKGFGSGELMNPALLEVAKVEDAERGQSSNSGKFSQTGNLSSKLQRNSFWLRQTSYLLLERDCIVSTFNETMKHLMDVVNELECVKHEKLRPVKKVELQKMQLRTLRTKL